MRFVRVLFLLVILFWVVMLMVFVLRKPALMNHFHIHSTITHAQTYHQLLSPPQLMLCP